MDGTNTIAQISCPQSDLNKERLICRFWQLNWFTVVNHHIGNTIRRRYVYQRIIMLNPIKKDLPNAKFSFLLILIFNP